MTAEQGDQSGAVGLPTVTEDVCDLSVKDLAHAVTGMCSAYGTVIKVMIHISHAHLNVRAFALVDMSEDAEAERLAVAFNRSRMGSAVLLLLPPRPAN
jgi:hypothetical protein